MESYLNKMGFGGIGQMDKQMKINIVLGLVAVVALGLSATSLTMTIMHSTNKSIHKEPVVTPVTKGGRY